MPSSLRPITTGMRPYLSRAAKKRPSSVITRSEQLPRTFSWTWRMPSMIESCVAMSAETTSVGPTMPELVENCSWEELLRKSSRLSASMLVMSPTVTMPNVPSFEHMISGWGSVSDMTPSPILPSKRPTSFSNFDRNGEF